MKNFTSEAHMWLLWPHNLGVIRVRLEKLGFVCLGHRIAPLGLHVYASAKLLFQVPGRNTGNATACKYSNGKSLSKLFFLKCTNGQSSAIDYLGKGTGRGKKNLYAAHVRASHKKQPAMFFPLIIHGG